MKKVKNLVLSTVCFCFLLISCNDDDTSFCVEDVQEDCFCTQQYDPVCGCNEVTYGNACMAECAGITDYIQGECQ